MIRTMLIVFSVVFALSSHVVHSAECIIAPTGVCTMDINLCGNPSVCQCPEGYTYNAATSQCNIADLSHGQANELTSPALCSAQPGVCTRDINQCGNPSTCQCEEGFSYNAVTGMCDKVLQ